MRCTLLVAVLTACGSAPPPVEHVEPRPEPYLPRHCDLAGRVLLGRIPVRYFGVTLTGSYETPFGWRPTTVQNTDGRFCIASDDWGSYDVIIAGPTFARRILQHVSIPRAAETDLGDITVASGDTVGGRVVDSLGNPVANAPVRLSAGLPESLDRDLLTDLARNIHHATTDDQGDYSIAGVSTREWENPVVEIAVVIPGVASSGRHRISGSSTNLTLNPVGAVEVAVTGNLQVDTAITLQSEIDAENWLVGVPDENGLVRIADVPVGPYRVGADRGQVYGPKLVVTVGQTTSTTFTLP